MSRMPAGSSEGIFWAEAGFDMDAFALRSEGAEEFHMMFVGVAEPVPRPLRSRLMDARWLDEAGVEGTPGCT